MAIKSERQRAWVNSPEGLKALGPERVKAWNDEVQGQELPHRVEAQPKPSKKTEKPKRKFSSGIRWA